MNKIVKLSLIASMFTAGAFASDAQMKKELDELKSQVAELQKTLKKAKVETLKEQISEVKALAASNNIKWDVDLRTSMDSIEYETASGKTYKNDALLSNRLWLGMAYQPVDNLIFKGQLSYNKAFGANPPSYSTNGYPQRGYGFDTFDWVVNENLVDNNLKVRQAYWLYFGDAFLGADIPWTASVGRRPSTGGFISNLREDDKPQSPSGHLIDVEFDGASFKFDLDKVAGVTGMYWKLCLGRGLTNARARFNTDGGLAAMGDYSEDDTTLENIDMAGFIFVPYDNGQYQVQTTYYRGFNVPGFRMVDPASMSGGVNTGMISFVDGNGNGVPDSYTMNKGYQMKNLGDQDGAGISIQVNGVGEFINDFLDNTKLFASFAWSRSNPSNELNTIDMNAMMAAMKQYNMTLEQAFQAVNAGQMSLAPFMTKAGMLGSTESETGTSYWLGAQFPALITENGKIGLEFNHGSKYWRNFTYGEDTLAASKLAARGDAYEVYFNQPLIKDILSMQIRFTHIAYDYTGSQGFFGADGTPMSMAEATAMGMDPIEKIDDLRVYFRYRY
ncbi:MAG: DUF3373 domain-containing protein [Campylobacterales bacterium]|nr:DUF3373 domain-containing protein [Campylobacterales bacterium]